MKYLLDTNAWLWFVNADQRLGQQARDLIENEWPDCAISIISLWEIVIKVRLGKLNLPGDVFKLIDEMQIELVDLSQYHLKSLQNLKTQITDPFDQLLAAQAIYEKAWLVTADKALLRQTLSGLRTIDLQK